MRSLPIPLLTSVVTKALSHQCQRMIFIAPGWPNMLWFWDLVELSSQIPVYLPNYPDLLTQPFSGSLHRDLQNVNLHLTFKTVFLLALGSGKRRSEIHARVKRNIRHQSDWSSVSLLPKFSLKEPACAGGPRECGSTGDHGPGAYSR